MKRILSFLISLAMLAAVITAAAQAEAVPGNRLGLDILTMQTDGGQNAFVSPVSLAYALSLAASGARGDALEEILLALEAPDAAFPSAWSEPLAQAGLKIANAAFAAAGIPIREDYTSLVRDLFGARLFSLDAPQTVNAWVREHTDGLIDKLLDEDEPVLADLLLVNAIAMDAEWFCPFDPSLTSEGIFHAPDGDVTAQFMRQTLTADYAQAEGAQAVKLYYREGGLYMLLILPEEGRLADTLTLLSERGMDLFTFDLRTPESIIEGYIASQKEYNADLDEDALRGELAFYFNSPEPWEVSLAMPKVDISTGASLRTALMDLGVSAPFSDGADFSGICDSPLLITDVIQKVRVQADEKGTRAAAVTSVELNSTAVMYEQAPVRMVLDRPFLMLIADEETGAICFAGVVADPA